MFKGDRNKAVKPGDRCETITPLRTLLPYNVAVEDIWPAEEVKSEGVKTAG